MDFAPYHNGNIIASMLNQTLHNKDILRSKLCYCYNYAWTIIKAPQYEKTYFLCSYIEEFVSDYFLFI